MALNPNGHSRVCTCRLDDGRVLPYDNAIPSDHSLEVDLAVFVFIGAGFIFAVDGVEQNSTTHCAFYQKRKPTSNKYDVTFHFVTCTSTVRVEAETEEAADVAARTQLYPPVPDSVRSTVVQIKRGGAGRGQGNKAGRKRVKEPRCVRKGDRWTKKEWALIEERAKLFGMSTTDYKRHMILKDGKGA